MIKYKKSRKQEIHQKWYIFDMSTSIEKNQNDQTDPWGTIKQYSYIVYEEMSKGDALLVIKFLRVS